MQIHELTALARNNKASDIHISEGLPLMFRIDGHLAEAPVQLSAAETRSLILSLMDEAHPYYVRTAAPDDFLRSVTADHWGAGVVTSAVNTYAMLAWARRQLAADPACFIAGIR